MGKLRVHQLAKELGLSSKDFIQKAQDLGFDYIKSHANTLDESDIRELRNKLGAGAQESQKPKRRTVLRRRAVRSSDEDSGAPGEVRVITSRLSEGEERVIETKKIEIPTVPEFDLDEFTPPTTPVQEELSADNTPNVELTTSPNESTELLSQTPETSEEVTPVADSTTTQKATTEQVQATEADNAAPETTTTVDTVQTNVQLATEEETSSSTTTKSTAQTIGEPEKATEDTQTTTSVETTQNVVVSNTQGREPDVQTTSTSTTSSTGGQPKATQKRVSTTVAPTDAKTSVNKPSSGNRQMASIVRRIELPSRRRQEAAPRNNDNRSGGGARRQNNGDGNTNSGSFNAFQPSGPPPDRDGPDRRDNKKGPRKKRRVQKMRDEVEFNDRKGGRRRKKKKEKKSTVLSTVPMSEKKRVVRVDEVITIGDLAHQMSLKATEIIRHLLSEGKMVTINQSISVEEATEIAKNFDYEVQSVGFEEQEILKTEVYENSPDDLKNRAPIVTVMGHVDHGKTSLLDSIRTARVAASEAGGITQHIGAYSVETESQGRIVFLDTPGHEAFTAMRARGAQCTDIVILVVAADDGIMPQTVEAINHSKAAEVPIVVAINKIDKPGANPDQVKYSLMNYGLIAEEFGGDVMMIPVSAHTKEGLPELLESVLLQAEILELQANPDRPAQGIVVESRLEKGRGPVATLLVQEGTIRVGDSVVTGAFHGRIRAMFNDHNQPTQEAGPAYPVKILGLSGLPNPGDLFNVVADEKAARQVAEHRADQLRRKEQGAASRRPSFADMWGGNEKKEVNFILKADVQGTLQALKESLSKIEHEEVLLNITHSAVGGITENDINLAATTDGIIVGFNVRADSMAQRLAENEGVEIRIYRVIYDLIDDVKAAMSEHIAPTLQEKPIGSAEIRKIFTVPKAGKVAGSYVLDGKITRGCLLRLYRNDIEIYAGKVQTLKRFKDDVREVSKAYECGIQIEGFQDIREGDIIEAYELEEIKVTLE